MTGFDAIVVGLGHAGAEAALAAARLGAHVAAVTQVPERACLMSCNPAVGGPGKSQVVREIDVLGGAMASAADESAIQVRRLNASKGSAGWATRLQVDRVAYARAMQRRLKACAGLTMIQGEAMRLLVRGGKVVGLELQGDVMLTAPAVILTTGTFLAARMHVGAERTVGGRTGDTASEGLSPSLRAMGVALGRYKTGTPPRLEGLTIDWNRCEEQPSEPSVGPLSIRTPSTRFPLLPQQSAYVTRTTPAAHAAVLKALDQSPMSTGAITGRGPRYCPSLEQKVVSYPERLGHLVYLERDGLDTTEVYPAGLSTSLPADVQQTVLRAIPGLERVEILKPGYAVEYDYLRFGQLTPWLELRGVQGLFFAGQINGSSGYEEAAAQGLVAGVNAVRVVRSSPPWIPSRATSYIGVLCDDLIHKGFEEPYRLLPSRAENRLQLREDNTQARMIQDGLDLGLVERSEGDAGLAMLARVEETERRLSPADLRWLRHPERSLVAATAEGPLQGMPNEIAGRVFSNVRYAPYQKQQQVAAGRRWAAREIPIPFDLDFRLVVGLSAEAAGVLARSRPLSLADASKLPGVGEDATAILFAHLKRREAIRSVSRGTDR